MHKAHKVCHAPLPAPHQPLEIIPIQVIRDLNLRIFVSKEIRMVRPLKIAWKHTEEELYDLYRREKDADLARRWRALGLC